MSDTTDAPANGPEGNGQPNGDTAAAPANGPAADPRVVNGDKPAEGGDKPAETTDGKPAEGAEGKAAEAKPETDWKAHSRRHEDEKKAEKEAHKATTAERDRLAGVLDKLRKEIDPNASDEETDPAKVAESAVAARDKAAAEAKLARVELAAERAARKAGADVDRLLDSRLFLAEVEKLDATDDKFLDQVKDLVVNTMEAYPHLAAASTPAKPSGSTEITGGGEGKRPSGPSGIEAHRKARADRKRY